MTPASVPTPSPASFTASPIDTANMAPAMTIGSVTSRGGCEKTEKNFSPLVRQFLDYL